MDRGAPYSELVRLISRISWRISAHLWSAAATSRLPFAEQAKTRTMPADNSLRLYNH